MHLPRPPRPCLFLPAARVTAQTAGRHMLPNRPLISTSSPKFTSRSSQWSQKSSRSWVIMSTVAQVAGSGRFLWVLSFSLQVYTLHWLCFTFAAALLSDHRSCYVQGLFVTSCRYGEGKEKEKKKNQGVLDLCKSRHTPHCLHSKNHSTAAAGVEGFSHRGK